MERGAWLSLRSKGSGKEQTLHLLSRLTGSIRTGHGAVLEFGVQRVQIGEKYLSFGIVASMVERYLRDLAQGWLQLFLYEGHPGIQFQLAFPREFHLPCSSILFLTICSIEVFIIKSIVRTPHRSDHLFLGVQVSHHVKATAQGQNGHDYEIAVIDHQFILLYFVDLYVAFAQPILLGDKYSALKYIQCKGKQEHGYSWQHHRYARFLIVLKRASVLQVEQEGIGVEHLDVLLGGGEVLLARGGGVGLEERHWTLFFLGRLQVIVGEVELGHQRLRRPLQQAQHSRYNQQLFIFLHLFYYNGRGGCLYIWTDEIINKNKDIMADQWRTLNESEEEYLLMSKQCFQGLQGKSAEQVASGQDINWSSDCRVEMPILMKREGPGAEAPTTLIEEFQKTLRLHGQKQALLVKREGRWISWNYVQFYEESKAFARACLSLGISHQKAINIIGFNAPEWMMAFWGSLFGGFLPVGVYTTNNAGTCRHLFENSGAEMVVCENASQLQKYLSFWDECPSLKYVVIYNDSLPVEMIPEKRRGQVLLWKDLLEKGQGDAQSQSLEEKMSSVRPGTCCTLVYTSGTTGNPKGVILSHDNYSWTAKRVLDRDIYKIEVGRMVSYLPLSHVASQIIDIVTSVMMGASLYFADEKALQGTLVQTLQEVRPNMFFGVPRVWEKIEEKLKAIGLQNGAIKNAISGFAKARGEQGTFQELKNQETGTGFNIAKSLVYNKVKQALGLDQCLVYLVGAAPLNLVTKKYFASLNIYIHNAYGMSENSGPQTLTNMDLHTQLDNDMYLTAGQKLAGTDMMIDQPDKDGNGEICMKGRNRFVGYHNNEAETRKTIDPKGYLHSGDIGKIDSKGNLFITGRLKELIITAGGENVSPILIEDDIKSKLPFIANAMVVGEAKKYLVVLLSFKLTPQPDGSFTQNITEEAQVQLRQLGSQSKNVEEGKKDPVIKKAIDSALESVNAKTISRASKVQKWAMLDSDFSVVGGELTPSMKLKRNVTSKKYASQIAMLYTDPAL